MATAYRDGRTDELRVLDRELGIKLPTPGEGPAFPPVPKPKPKPKPKPSSKNLQARAGAPGGAPGGPAFQQVLGARALEQARLKFREQEGTAPALRNLREALDRYRVEAAETQRWREEAMREAQEAHEGAQDEAYARYTANVELLEEIFYGDQVRDCLLKPSAAAAPAGAGRQSTKQSLEALRDALRRGIEEEQSESTASKASRASLEAGGKHLKEHMHVMKFLYNKADLKKHLEKYCTALRIDPESAFARKAKLAIEASDYEVREIPASTFKGGADYKKELNDHVRADAAEWTGKMAASTSETAAPEAPPRQNGAAGVGEGAGEGGAGAGADGARGSLPGAGEAAACLERIIASLEGGPTAVKEEEPEPEAPAEMMTVRMIPIFLFGSTTFWPTSAEHSALPPDAFQAEAICLS